MGSLTLMGAPPLKLSYSVTAHRSSWQPIQKSDRKKAVEASALEVLTKSGKIQVGEPHQADAHLLIDAQLLDEAHTHTVLLSVQASGNKQFPSLMTSDTVALKGLKRGQILQKIEASARKAAKKLYSSLGPTLKTHHQIDADSSPGFDDQQELPFHWTPVSVPRPKAGRAEKELWSKKRKKQEEALRVLSSLARTAKASRNVLERCALEHPSLKLRKDCLKALKPLSRQSAHTRRVVIEVYRKQPKKGRSHDIRRLREEALEQMKYFSGVEKRLATQAMLSATAAGHPPKIMQELGDLPNLDVAIHRCLQATGKKKRTENRSRFSCISLMKPLPHGRRWALLKPYLRQTDPGSPYYLRGAGKSEGRIGTPWERAFKAVLETAPRWKKEWGKLLWKRYQNSLSASSINMLSGYAPANKKNANWLLEAVQTGGNQRALMGLQRMGQQSDRLRETILASLVELEQTQNYPKELGVRRLQSTINRLQSYGKKRQRR